MPRASTAARITAGCEDEAIATGRVAAIRRRASGAPGTRGGSRSR